MVLKKLADIGIPSCLINLIILDTNIPKPIDRHIIIYCHHQKKYILVWLITSNHKRKDLATHYHGSCAKMRRKDMNKHQWLISQQLL